GSPTGNSGIGLTVDLEKCTCFFVGASFVDTTITPGDIKGIRSAGRATGAGISVKDFADVISGSKSFPGHTEIWGAQHFEESWYEAGGYGYLLFADPANDGNLGAANVTYSFTVEIPESQP
ncbi:MAG: hypothetical protein ACM3SU_15910, partial [Acidobacteriota bacterium]